MNHFYIYFVVVAYCSSFVAADADLSYEVPSAVSSEASEGKRAERMS